MLNEQPDIFLNKQVSSLKLLRFSYNGEAKTKQKINNNKLVQQKKIHSKCPIKGEMTFNTLNRTDQSKIQSSKFKCHHFKSPRPLEILLKETK